MSMAGSYKGLTPFRSLNLKGTPQQVKGTGGTSSRGNLCGGFLTNESGVELYVKFYDSAAAPTVGTDTPVLTIPIPLLTTLPIQSVAPLGVYFANGIWVAATANIADSDTTDPADGDCIVNLFVDP
jgi:hypothetical protein